MSKQLLDIGSYSNGSLRDEDMLIMFDTIAIMTDCVWCKNQVHVAQANDKWANHHEVDCEIDECTISDNARDLRSWIIEDLFDHTNDTHTPDGYFFGSYPGDGADFGVWEVVYDVT